MYKYLQNKLNNDVAAIIVSYLIEDTVETHRKKFMRCKREMYFRQFKKLYLSYGYGKWNIECDLSN